MVENYKNIHSPSSQLDSSEHLRTPTEQQMDHVQVQLTSGSEGIASPQDLGSDNIVRWFEQGGGENPNSEDKTPSPPKSRRKLTSGSDQVKHRRTRSGCYTCRARRVKCDEMRPICERCRKGPRECAWPPEASNKSISSSKAGKPIDTGTDSSGNDDEEEDDVLPNIRSISKNSILGISDRTKLTSLKTTDGIQNRSAMNNKHSSDYVEDKSMSPTTTESTRPDSDLVSPCGQQSTVSTNTSHEDILWSRLRQDHQFYLNYHQQSLSYCYYFLKQDFCRFIETTLIDAALAYEPLLHAVVGFSAFHYALAHPGKQISSFLRYYNNGVSMLRKDLVSGKPHTDATIYTILQLATFEEYLGDWANLRSHQKAACEIIKSLYTPQTMMQTDTSRTLFAWYIRFDIFVGFMAGSETLIGFEWFQAYYDRTKRLTTLDPGKISYKLEALNAENRILGMTMTMLFAKLPRGEIAIDEFAEKNQKLLQSIETWAERVRALRLNSDHLVYEFNNRRSPALEDIVDPFEPGVIFDTTFFSANYMMMDCLALEVMHKMQTSTILQQPPSPDLTDLSLQQCQIFEAIQEYGGAPSGAFLPAQVNIGLVCLFVPRDDRHISWCRKMLARFENCGYIYPPSFRAKVAEGWSMPTLKQSWLADNYEQPQIIKELRHFIDERTTKPQTQQIDDIRSMRAVLEKLNLEESPKNSPDSASSTSDALYSPVRGGGLNQAWHNPQQTTWPRQPASHDYYGGNSLG